MTMRPRISAFYVSIITFMVLTMDPCTSGQEEVPPENQLLHHHIQHSQVGERGEGIYYDRWATPLPSARRLLKSKVPWLDEMNPPPTNVLALRSLREATTASTSRVAHPAAVRSNATDFVESRRLAGNREDAFHAASSLWQINSSSDQVARLSRPMNLDWIGFASSTESNMRCALDEEAVRLVLLVEEEVNDDEVERPKPPLTLQGTAFSCISKPVCSKFHRDGNCPPSSRCISVGSSSQFEEVFACALIATAASATSPSTTTSTSADELAIIASMNQSPFSQDIHDDDDSSYYEHLHDDDDDDGVADDATNEGVSPSTFPSGNAGTQTSSGVVPPATSTGQQQSLLPHQKAQLSGGGRPATIGDNYPIATSILASSCLKRTLCSICPMMFPSDRTFCEELRSGLHHHEVQPGETNEEHKQRSGMFEPAAVERRPVFRLPTPSTSAAPNPSSSQAANEHREVTFPEVVLM